MSLAAEEPKSREQELRLLQVLPVHMGSEEADHRAKELWVGKINLQYNEDWRPQTGRWMMSGKAASEVGVADRRG